MSLVINLIDKVTELVKLKVEQVKVELKGQAAVVLSKLIVFFVIALLITFAFFFLGLALAFYLNSVLPSTFWGFAIVGGIAIIISVGLIILARSEAFNQAIKNNILGND